MHALEKLIVAFHDDAELELEMCLCRKNVADQPKDLPQDAAHQIATMLQKASEKGHFTNTNCCFVDYFYDNGEIRHRCFLDKKREPETTRKTRVGRVLATCPQREYTFCFNLKREERLAHFNPLEAGCPHHVRIQQEWTFEYKNAFQYVVKKVQSGGTSKEECLQRPLHFEFEIELKHDSEYLRQRTATQVAESWVEKCLDLCGRYDSTNDHKEALTMIFEATPDETQREVDPTPDTTRKPQTSKQQMPKRHKKTI